MFANIIFPAPSSAYVSTLFMPLAAVLALGTELFVFYRLQRGVTSAANLVAIVMALNILSWIAGFVISTFLPSGLVPRLMPDGDSIIGRGPEWRALAILSYPTACVVSATLEHAAVRLFFRQLRDPLRTVLAANVASYIVLVALVLAKPAVLIRS